MTEFRGNCRTPEIPLLRQTRRSVETGQGLHFGLEQ